MLCNGRCSSSCPAVRLSVHPRSAEGLRFPLGTPISHPVPPRSVNGGTHTCPPPHRSSPRQPRSDKTHRGSSGEAHIFPVNQNRSVLPQVEPGPVLARGNPSSRRGGRDRSVPSQWPPVGNRGPAVLSGTALPRQQSAAAGRAAVQRCPIRSHPSADAASSPHRRRVFGPIPAPHLLLRCNNPSWGLSCAFRRGYLPSPP